MSREGRPLSIRVISISVATLTFLSAGFYLYSHLAQAAVYMQHTGETAWVQDGVEAFGLGTPSSTVSSTVYIGLISSSSNPGASSYTSGWNLDRYGASNYTSYESSPCTSASFISSSTMPSGNILFIWQCTSQTFTNGKYYGFGSAHTALYHQGSDQGSYDNVNFAVGTDVDEIIVLLSNSPYVISGTLQQYESDATTTITPGGVTTESSTVVFGADLVSPGTTTVKLEVEVQSTGSSFTGTPTVSSTYVSSGSRATTSFSGSNGSYRWQARAKDSNGATSSWRLFGADSTSTVDFNISVTTTTVIQIDNVQDLGYSPAGNHISASFTVSSTPDNILFVVAKPWAGNPMVGVTYNGAAMTLLDDVDSPHDLGGHVYLYYLLNASSGSHTLDAQGSDNNFTAIAASYVGVAQTAPPAPRTTYSGSAGGGSITNTLSAASADNLMVIGAGWQTGNAIASSTPSGSPTSTVHAQSVAAIGFIDSGCVRSSFFCYTFPSAGATTISPYQTGSWGEYEMVSAMIQPWFLATELSGTITTSTTWARARSPFVVTSTVTINSGVKVTVEDGAVIKFKDDTGLIVNGELDIRGTSSSLAYFTSFHDDSVGGDTNGDGTSTSPSVGNWGDIQIGPGASTTFSGVVVRYGGSSSTASDANIYNNGGTLNITLTDVSYSGHYGLRHASGTTTVSNSQIHDNDVGINVASGTVTAASSSIFNNSGYGAFQGGTPSSTMSGNFWGGWQPLDQSTSTSYNAGPYNISTNSSGYGDQVSSYINYDPYTVAYLSSPYYPTWSPPGVNTDGGRPYTMRVGSSTQYQDQLFDGEITWNSSSSGYVSIIDASSSSSSTWDIYVRDIDDPNQDFAGQWFPSTTSTPFIIFNADQMDNLLMNEQCATTHELGHALGLAHSPSGNIMDKTCVWPFDQTNLGTQDIDDFNLLWSPSYFFDPHRTKAMIKW